MKLYITRHGTTIWNIEQKLQGWQDSNLSEEGVHRAVMLGNRLSDVDFDLIYSSPQNRALETAKLIRGKKNTSIITHKSLRELGFGSWEGMEIPFIEKEYPEEYYTYINNPENYIPIDGESFEDLFDRVQKFLHEIVKLDAENILVVTHGVTIKAMLKIIKGLTFKEFATLPVYTGTSLNICNVKGNKIELLVEGDTTHIDYDFFEESSV